MKTKFNTKKYHGQEIKCKILGARCIDDWGHVPVYDYGYGRLYVYIQPFGNFMAPTGIVRAMSWYDAFEIARCEFTAPAEWDDLDDEDRMQLKSGCSDNYEWTDNGLRHVYPEDSLETIESLGWEFEIEIEVGE